MRRLLSILLLLSLGLGPAFVSIPAHALASGWTGKIDEASVPACCRRNGKHHCSMDTTPASNGEKVLTSSEGCPCLPHNVASVASNSAAIVAASASALLVPASRPAKSRDSEKAQTTEKHTQPQRGPPASLLL